MKKVTVLWSDAVIYSEGKIPPALSLMTTTGELLQENETFLLIKSPVTRRVGRPWHLKNFISSFRPKRPNYYFIPRGMIQKIESA